MTSAILFDWDGTLLDSAEVCFRTYRRLFASFDLPFDRERFENTYSPDWRLTYSWMGLPEAVWVEADSRWYALYLEEQADLLPGARNALARIRDAGLAMGLVTGGDGRRVRGDLARLGVQEVFSAVVCAEDASRRKPHPDGLFLALDRLGVGPRDAVYVGDSPEDVEMARAVGVYAVGIPGGFPNEAALRRSGPDLFAPNLGHAVEALLGLPR